jgi:Ca-activated chloride channel family protein
MVPGGDPSTDAIPLLSTAAEVNIAGVIADVSIVQVYKNDGERPIEAIYVFPASTRAAVYGMKMTIGDRVIEARIAERSKARQDYEDARENGQTASLLEQERPNVFTMNVANIMPGDSIRVEMKYTELLVPESGIYEFVYPAVVGPRYSGSNDELATTGDRWVRNPYTGEGKSPLYDFHFHATVSAGLPIQEVSCGTHEMDINYEDPSRVVMELKEGMAASGNRDVIVRYRLAGGKIESGLLLFEGERENFFLAMVQPPARPDIRQIPPREYVFIVDVSGSMYGFPLEISKKLMRDLLGNLRPVDRFNILLFAGGSSLFSDSSVEASDSNIKKAIDFIDKQQGGGGTELLPALRRALALERSEESLKFRATRAYARSFVILTDGYVTVEKEAFDLIRDRLGEASFFPFGIGSSVNRYIIEGMARAGLGTPFVVTSGEHAAATAERFRKYISSPVLTDIRIGFEGFDVYDVEPRAMADVFAERPLIIYGKWKGSAKGMISISGVTGEGKYSKTLDVSATAPDEGNAALTYLWARQRIGMLDDYASLDMYGDVREKEVTALGLKYNLLTRYTSFVAVDSRVRNEGGTSATVIQPLPLPDGVSNYAVGGVSAYGAKQSSAVSGRGYQPASVSLDRESNESLLTPEYDDPDEGLMIADNMATFAGDKEGIEAFIRKNLLYPHEAAVKQMEGYVYVSFIIEEDGSISEPEVLSSTDGVFEQEALRVVRLTDKLWKAADYAGQPVSSRMILLVAFRIGT